MYGTPCVCVDVAGGKGHCERARGSLGRSAFILCARREGKVDALLLELRLPDPDRIDMRYLGSSLAIIVCGGLGTALAWLLVSPLGLAGVAAGLVTAFAAMIAATLVFAGGVAAGRALRLLK
jgi:hypothetical protein